MSGLKILGANIDGLDMVETICSIENYIRLGKEDMLYNEKNPAEPRCITHQILTLNAEILYNAQQDPQLMQIINRADLVTPDGSGIVWGIRELAGREVERVTGIDLMTEICRQSRVNKWRIFLFGGKPGVAAEAGKKLVNDFGTPLAGILNGYFKPEDEEEILREINESRPDILFVAMGAPKQELWIEKYRSRLLAPVVIGVGGSFDVISGQVVRAPGFFQKLGIEWLWRLIKEPRRWKRMLALPKFVRLVKKTKRKRLA